MLSISKVLTLNKLHILEHLSGMGQGDDGPAVDYFHLGLPIVDPPYIRGSMILQLHLDFLYDNLDFFACGSPVDTGAVRFGFLDPPDRDAFLDEVTCDALRFVRLVGDLQALPAPVLDHVVQHRSTAGAREALLSHFAPSVVDFMLEHDEPNAWMFEFGLRRGYRVRAAHVTALLHPNTYSRVPVFARLRGMLGPRARDFNPRLGIESR